MSEAGSHQTGNGSGNGSRSKANAVKRSELYAKCRAEIEAKYPRLRREQFFPSLDAYMVICEVNKVGNWVGDFTYVLNTPDDFDPPITLYCTYAAGVVKLQAVYVDD